MGWGFSGVMGARLGGCWDLRKAQPYECYSELDFDIPVGKHGDCYDRYLVRMEEMRQSVRIMKQCLDKLRLPEGQGPFATRDSKIFPPLRAEMKRSMEATIEHFKLYSEGHHVPAGEIYAAGRSAERRIWRLPDRRRPPTRPYKCKIRRRRLLTCKRWTSFPVTCWRTWLRSSGPAKAGPGGYAPYMTRLTDDLPNTMSMIR